MALGPWQVDPALGTQFSLLPGLWPIGVLRGQGSGAGSLPTAPQALEDTAPHLHPHSLLCATCSDFASPTLTEHWLFLV